MLMSGGDRALLVNFGDKMMKRILLFALISLGSVFCGATTVSASDWVYVTSDKGGGVIYIDVESLKRDGDIVTAWEKVDSRKNKSEPSYESLYQLDYDCSKRTVALLFKIERFRNKPAKSQDFYSLRYRGGSPVVPDSIGEITFDFACSK